MKAEVIPILGELRAIYEIEARMDRYNQYVHLMTKEFDELLPLGDFSPMGQNQKKYLDELLALGAETIAQEICIQVSDELSLPKDLRVMLVVLDEPRNGWTQRFLTEASWRFGPLPSLRSSCGGNPVDTRDWVPVQLWTCDDYLKLKSPSSKYLSQQIRSAIFRACWKINHGIPETFRDILAQEGATANFSGESFSGAKKDLNCFGETLVPFFNASDFPTIFSAMYGDSAAQSVGYAPMGIPNRGGFAYAQSLV